jgi:hypothetical protein
MISNSYQKWVRKRPFANKFGRDWQVGRGAAAGACGSGGDADHSSQPKTAPEHRFCFLDEVKMSKYQYLFHQYQNDKSIPDKQRIADYQISSVIALEKINGYSELIKIALNAREDENKVFRDDLTWVEMIEVSVNEIQAAIEDLIELRQIIFNSMHQSSDY